MTFNIKNKVALITGASSGMGREFAKAFALKGARVALTGQNREALEKVKKSITEQGASAHSIGANLTDIPNIPLLVKQFEDHFGDPIEILVNNAGIAVLGNVENVPLEAYQENLQINFFAPLALIKAVIPGMKRKKRGQIINISSGVGKRGLPGASSYCVSKFALNALTESIRVELSSFGIDVLSFSPGLTQTAFHSRLKIFGPLDEDFTGGNLGTPEDTAKRLIQASEKSEREVTVSFRTRVAIHLNYWFPSVLDKILERNIQVAKKKQEKT